MDVDQYHVRVRRPHPTRDRISASHWKVGAGVRRARYARAIHQHLQQSALLVIGSDNDDR